MIAIIDYGMGNICSVENALRRLGAEYTLTDRADCIRSADKVILPGVGHCGEAMTKLRDKRLHEIIRDLRRPVLGICVGMQVMCRHTDEGNTDCLGLFDADVVKFGQEDGLKVPHMGWNSISNLDGKIFRGIKSGEYVYYVHSYYAKLCSDTIATTDYGNTMFSAALKYENFYGTQFHPEKSGGAGECLLRNFLNL